LKDAEAWFQDGMKHIELSWHADYQSERTGDLEDAVAAFECAISLSPEHAGAWAQKGSALSRLGRYEDAAAALAEAVRSSPDDAGLRLERGHALARLERHDEALDCYDQALARRPEDADSWFLKAETLEALGRNAEALIAWDQYLRRHEDGRLSFFVGLASGLRAELRRAGVLARLGRRDDALTAYRAAFEKGADQLVHPVASVFHDALRNVEEARAAYAERLESRRDDPNTWRGAGQTFMYAERSQESLEAYDTMIRLVPNEPDAWFGKAEALVQAGRVSEAIAAYEQALRIRPDHQPAAIRLRVVRDRAGISVETPTPVRLSPELWKKIRANPRDRKLGDEYASQLEREGDPQGEFIRLCRAPEAERARTKARRQALLTMHGHRWYPTPPGAEAWWSDVAHLDGTGYPDHLGAGSDALTRLAFWVDHYPLRVLGLQSITDWSPLIHELERGGHFARLGKLHIAESLDGTFRALRDASAGIEFLSLSTLNVRDPRSLCYLSEGALLENVKELAIDLDPTPLEGDVLGGIWRKATRLEGLSLVHKKPAAGVLDGLDCVRRLSRVRIRGGLNESQVTALWHKLDPSELRDFTVNDVGLTRGFLDVVATSTPGGLRALESLDLSFNSIDRVEALLRLALPSLRVLNLEANELGEAAIAEVANHPLVAQLAALGLSRNAVISSYEPIYDMGFEAGAIPIRISVRELRQRYRFPDTLVLT
jgi:tetratricopeptide (TPR) repeat protein